MGEKLNLVFKLKRSEQLIMLCKNIFKLASELCTAGKIPSNLVKNNSYETEKTDQRFQLLLTTGRQSLEIESAM